MTDRSDNRREQLEKRQELERKRADHEQQLRSDRMVLLKQPEFQRVARDWIGKAGLYRVTFTGNAQGNFLEGKRALGLEILNSLLEADTEARNLVLPELGDFDD